MDYVAALLIAATESLKNEKKDRIQRVLILLSVGTLPYVRQSVHTPIIGKRAVSLEPQELASCNFCRIYFLYFILDLLCKQ